MANLAEVRLRVLAALALAALAVPAGAAAQEPAPDPAALEVAEIRVRALEAAVERQCARLGIAPAPAPDPETLGALGARAAELRVVLRFLSARREVVRTSSASTRARVGPGVPALAVRLGLDLPPRPDPAAGRTLAAWLARAREVPRAAERARPAHRRIPLKARAAREPADPAGPVPDCPRGAAAALPTSGFRCPGYSR